ncbi:hypothetical protein H5J25_01865 [Sphingomonas aliaeris]|uniref:Uncharacterized protein n=1 Tax=Sphingomonas aliaeris TaxID=2759526 RepID=A0A974S4G6_9SPHN|nr:hypothetical protein [Sphingomonas aliaeris]QQV77577.1 hypothetical protein H5J25_01865 [Sphingomonas aliaeris]
MPRWLKLYLSVTGPLALVALAMPGLVVFGLFLLIIPGLILGFAPTAFLWGCIFAALRWLGARWLAERWRTPAALVATIALLIAFPTISILEARERAALYDLPDRIPAAPIRPTGDIRLESRLPRWDNPNRNLLGFRPYSCDNLCLALLFEPGVRSVTVNSSARLSHGEITDGIGRLDGYSRTYRLLPKGQCAMPLDPDLVGRDGLYGTTPEENRAIAAYWALRLGNDVCLAGETARTGWDVLIRSGEWTSGAPFPNPWSLSPQPAVARYFEVRDRRGPLARRFEVSVRALSLPFVIASMGGLENFRFGWGFGTIGANLNDGRSPDGPLDHVLRFSPIPARSEFLPMLRTSLQAALADPDRGREDAVFASLKGYLDALKGAPLPSADRALLLALVREPRVATVDQAYQLRDLFADDLPALRAAIVVRLLALPISGDSRTQSLGNTLSGWPDAAFTTLSADEARLLRDPDRRTRAAGLIKRLADQGGAAVPLLLEIAQTHRQRRNIVMDPDQERSRPEADDNAVDAARIALCLIGSAARSALPALELLTPTGGGFEKMDWDRMMLRLGKPLTRIEKPESLSGTTESYRRNLADWQARFDPARSCGRL